MMISECSPLLDIRSFVSTQPGALLVEHIRTKISPTALSPRWAARYNIDFYQFSGLMARRPSSGKKQQDLGKQMGEKSALSISDMLAKM